MIITQFKSYPYKDKKRGYTVARHTEMSHTKPEPIATNGIRTTVAKQEQQEVKKIEQKNPEMTFEIKIQNMRHLSTRLCSVTITKILQTINGI